MRQVKRCGVCRRFRSYEADDGFCLICGSDALESACSCGRGFDYALDEPGEELHCPRCGSPVRGRAEEYRG